MARTLSSLLMHIVFGTKDRTPLISSDLAERLWPYMGGIVRNLKGKAIVVGGMPDHVHMLIELPPAVSAADAVRTIKANSSRWVREGADMRSKFAWQSGYAAFSVSRSNCDAVAKYIREQEDHHRKVGFKEEFLSFLKKHRVDYDERVIWT